ncbi:MAG TPA: hypothetical protein PLR32_02330 [candidate division Zixibacteria bacterium]|mgnify:FL=1|nr:hypothetical protein [candidate division Zixibacteria bacterium]MDD4916855.1 hypothetical protein [candidate division Zixibacteria bacterium]MDM7973920.1 hypothetical protein [candidate division Zixibacteria bacterium]HOD65143.1 hypothetical protein [candidate division Zixibacteria bacterium]HOZ07226.1 hypothetical protein [candidate division Zixibacteria bacterium]
MAPGAQIRERLLCEWLARLELLIAGHFDALLGFARPKSRSRSGGASGPPRSAQNAKVSELIKMIQLYARLADSRPGTDEFWEMIERIRQEKLPLRPTGQLPAAEASPKKGRRP